MKNIEDIEKKIEQYKKSGTSGEKVPDILEKELEETRVRLGLLDITGEGISVILRDNESTIISANDILTLVNQLIISGAEAISINGNRFMNNTEIVAVNGKDILQVHIGYLQQEIRKIQKVELVQKIGYINQMLASGKSVEYSVGDNIEISKSSEEVKFKYGKSE